MKINYIAENTGFKKISDLKAGAKLSSEMTRDEKIEAVKQGARETIQDIAPQRFDEEIKSTILTAPNSIFEKSDNDLKVTEIEYAFNKNILYCKVTVEVNKDGYYINSGDAHLIVSYPENLRELENSLSEEYHCESKIIIKFIRGSRAQEFFDTPTYSHNSREIRLHATACKDLTEFCYLLNSFEGIDFSHWILVIANLVNGIELTSTKTEIPLKQKFQRISLKDFYPQEIDLNGILSEKETSEYFLKKLLDNGTGEYIHLLDNEHVTGIVCVLVPFQRHDGTVEGFLDIISEFRLLAEKMNNHSNVYFKVIFPHYVQFAHTRVSVFNYLERYLDNNYEKAREEGWYIEDPKNITLSFEFDGDPYSRIGIFPFIDHYLIGNYNNIVRRKK